MPASALRLAVTGGIGSGKSTVADRLVNLGATLVDADALSRELTTAGGAAIPHIVARFGTSILAPDGALDRNAMRTLVYADPSARHALERIIHPLVAQLALARDQGAELAGSACIVFDIPLLAESAEWRQRVDRVWVIDCAEAIQINRVMQRSQLSRDAVRSIIAAQTTRERRLCCADCVIDNSHLSLERLSEQVTELASSFGL